MSQRLAFLYISLLLFTSLAAAASDQNATRVNRIEVVITVAGMQESVRAIEKSSQHLAALTQQLSNKQDFTPKDQQLIVALTEALNRRRCQSYCRCPAEAVQRGRSRYQHHRRQCRSERSAGT